MRIDFANSGKASESCRGDTPVADHGDEAIVSLGTCPLLDERKTIDREGTAPTVAALIAPKVRKFHEWSPASD